MATGDDAAAAGMAVVDGAVTQANTIDTEINKTRDYIANGHVRWKPSLSPLPIGKGGTNATTAAAARTALGLALPIPIASGGTGGTTKAQAQTNLGLVPTATSADAEGKIPVYTAAGQLATGTPTSSGHAANKAYVDAQTPPAFNGGTVSGQILLPNAFAASSSYVVAYLNGDGRISRGASSRRYKKNIRNAPGRLFSPVLRLTARVFNWRKEVGPDDHDEVGLIAEEVAEILPWLVVDDAEGRPDAVRYEMLGLALLPIVQDLAERVAKLEAR